tara:strand:+ start:618 stop:947 length:330 start_codon:yes stop_codon:yes gene_type:complete
MAITVTAQVNSGKALRDAGITTGNEFIYKVSPQSKIQVTGIATATGDARVFFSNDPHMANPTDFATSSGLVGSSLGALTDYIGETMLEGIEWVGVDVTSGTWTVNIKEL